MNNHEYNPTVGMEVHVELKTKSKMFCGCPADHFSKAPNTQTCPVCLALPGALPVPNRKAVEWTIKIGLALHCTINEVSKFDRKHYFYPDLPKGYQISQYDEPLCVNGYLDTKEGRVRITRVHLEEDTGKLQHTTLNGKRVTLVDFNRSGVPLVEIVTEPDIHTPSQAKEYTQKLQQIIRYLEVSDADMEKGSMRLEANISWGLEWGYKVEVKNLNSFRFVERAVAYEFERQKALLEKGEIPSQETRGWNENQNKTVHQRYKESSADYRYFPEPDIPPMRFTTEEIDKYCKELPLLPEAIAERFVKEYGIRFEYADQFAGDKAYAEKAENVFKEAVVANVSVNEAANIMINKKAETDKLSVKEIVALIKNKNADIVTDEKQIESWIDKAIKENPRAVEDFKKGKGTAIAAFMGPIMRESKGKADPKKVQEILRKKLAK
jgi:aspartyl-tRNA(Asn)/glutamyl-tRNA(Gln) amidotransferase subunit B